MSEGTDKTTDLRWTIANPDNGKSMPWILYFNGVPVQPFASYGAAYNAMVIRQKNDTVQP